MLEIFVLLPALAKVLWWLWKIIGDGPRLFRDRLLSSRDRAFFGRHLRFAFGDYSLIARNRRSEGTLDLRLCHAVVRTRERDNFFARDLCQRIVAARKRK